MRECRTLACGLWSIGSKQSPEVPRGRGSEKKIHLFWWKTIVWITEACSATSNMNIKRAEKHYRVALLSEFVVEVADGNVDIHCALDCKKSQRFLSNLLHDRLSRERTTK